jgi:diaminopimelate epimerase
MKIQFMKMNGAGNDFVMIDNRRGRIRLGSAGVRMLCHRRRGIGADGVILIETAPGLDFRMRYFNKDGGEAEMCGNGARCAALYAVALGLGEPSGANIHLRFIAAPGLFEADVDGDQVTIAMTDATRLQKMISLPVAQGEEMVHFIDSGVPHAVMVERDVDALSDREIVTRGRAVRGHSQFAPEGANANFVSSHGKSRILIRTYERGVEAETLACGTGAVASAVVLAHLGIAESPVTLLTRGGDELTVSFSMVASGAREVRLQGPSAFNFEGSTELSTEE